MRRATNWCISLSPTPLASLSATKTNVSLIDQLLSVIRTLRFVLGQRCQCALQKRYGAVAVGIWQDQHGILSLTILIVRAYIQLNVVAIRLGARYVRDKAK
jgi:hypothetical protein